MQFVARCVSTSLTPKLRTLKYVTPRHLSHDPEFAYCRVAGRRRQTHTHRGGDTVGPHGGVQAWSSGGWQRYAVLCRAVARAAP